MSLDAYQQIKTAEPRLVHLERTAMLAVADGTPADQAYTDAKPFIGCLVGWNRGKPVLLEKPSPLQHRYARAITGTVFGGDTLDLTSPDVFQTVSAAFRDLLVAADRRWSA
jgi:hypothetical protein